MIEKIQNDINNFLFKELYYGRARDAMFDIIDNLSKKGYKEIYIPGYIGWSPKEGSGIFDPINKIVDLNRHYYVMDRELNIDLNYLKLNLKNSSILLVVNYFGFRDSQIDKIVELAHERNCIVIEDNAHGFYTYHLSKKCGSDFTFFSLHKMLPFSKGGSMIVCNPKFYNLPYTGKEFNELNPYSYDIYSIAYARKDNFRKLYNILNNYKDLIKPLKNIEDIQYNVPQTFPIILLKGNRDKIYDLMNKRGYGVVSLYHTMVNELQNDKHSEAIWLSQHIMNLPVHQDVESQEYINMVKTLIHYIKETIS